MVRIVRALIGRRQGAAAIEYGLIAALKGLGGKLQTTFGNVTSNLKAS